MVLKRLTTNFVSFAGLLITSVSLVFIVLILVAAWLGFESNPYIGVFAFLILPGFALLGLVMMPLGKAWERRRAGHPIGMIRVEIDLEKPSTRRRIMTFVIVASVLFAVLGATTYQSVRFMDTTTFCGEVCHSVMQPELTSYRHSPHARVPCVECHIGEGADWYVKSKLSGLGQVIAVTFNTYERPIPTPVQNLRPARETCEKCHWPEEFHSYKLVVKSHFQEDSANTMVKNVLLMKVGGGSAKSGGTEGIHWHMNIKNRIEYVAMDRERDTIAYIHMTDLDGRSTEYVMQGLDKPIEELRSMPRRVMDCMDCHSRPSHVFEYPDVAVDEALVTTDLPQDLPYLRREAVRVLTQEYPTREAAARDIRVGLRHYYLVNYPELAASQGEKIDRAADVLAEIYLRNVFPEMHITWGTYRNFIGHTHTNGCFRCHDEAHVSPEGLTIPQGCNTCHELLAFEEENPKPVLDSLPRR